MAAARHNPTRRAVLGAAVALPACLAADPTRKQRREAVWERALAAYRRAEAALTAYGIDVAGPAERAFQTVRGRWPLNHDFVADPEAQAEVTAAWDAHAQIESRFNDLECARLEALKRLLRTSALDLPALALKIELAVDQEAATLDGGEQCLAVLKADGWRLARARTSALSS
jgi:hypothetical protein